MCDCVSPCLVFAMRLNIFPSPRNRSDISDMEKTSDPLHLPRSFSYKGTYSKSEDYAKTKQACETPGVNEDYSMFFVALIYVLINSASMDALPQTDTCAIVPYIAMSSTAK